VYLSEHAAGVYAEHWCREPGQPAVVRIHQRLFSDHSLRDGRELLQHFETLHFLCSVLYLSWIYRLSFSQRDKLCRLKKRMGEQYRQSYAVRTTLLVKRWPPFNDFYNTSWIDGLR
jgi:hypothetical protein